MCVVADQVVCEGRSAGVLWQVSGCVVADQVGLVRADQRVCCGRSTVCEGRSTVCVVADQRVCGGTSGGVLWQISWGVVSDQWVRCGTSVGVCCGR